MVSKVVRKVKDRLGPYDDTASLSHIEAAPRMYEKSGERKKVTPHGSKKPLGMGNSYRTVSSGTKIQQ